MKSTSSNPVFSVIITALTQFGVLIGQTKGAELKSVRTPISCAVIEGHLTQR